MSNVKQFGVNVIHPGDNKELTPFKYPAKLHDCVTKVFSGEYAFNHLPDLGEIRTVIDIGGNVGAFAVWAKMIWPYAWVTSYEPHPTAAEFLRQNAPYGTRVVEAAVVAEVLPDGIDLFVGADEDWGYNSIDGKLNPTNGKTIRVETVSATTLPPCDVLKLDAEGVEREILVVYEHLKTCKMVMIEWHREEDLLPIMHACSVSGLRLIRSVHDRVNLGQLIYARTRAQFSFEKNAYVLPEVTE